MDIFLQSSKFSPFSSSKRSKSLLRPNDHPKATLLHSKSEVPKGYLAVYVGEDMKRFVIPTTYLSLQAFKELMEASAETFGYQNEGGLRIQCDAGEFEDTLKVLEGMKKGQKKEMKRRSFSLRLY
ncbi:uncharacterized protein A4U43_C05F7740 [Asparagus officinalis]|uniref:Uncharacterized protein n=1 Tax=Asparagus officinalis TaxID=4686 RepID=A0A5P1EQ46_ASPOF|nr:auxin-responsive protein SAUR71-like [Asparagus officinalis]ONK68128.1 uncharacterized protein A4U43_C05F7740 [Asparagus officinalis]